MAELNHKQQDIGQRNAFFATLCHHNPVMIFSTGKTGSTSLLFSLPKYYSGKIFRVESLPITYENAGYESGYFGPYQASDFWDYVFRRYIKAEHSVAGGDTKSDQTRLKIITPIREPISQSISSFYEMGLLRRLVVSEVVTQYSEKQLITYINHARLESLKAHYLKWFYHHRLHNQPIDLLSGHDWFDINMKPLGIDVYTQPFPEERYRHYTINQCDLMVMEHSLDDVLKEELIKKFLSLDTFKMKISNATADKNKVIANSYKRFNNEVRFPREFLDRIFSSQYFQHFYTKKDEERLREHWSE